MYSLLICFKIICFEEGISIFALVRKVLRIRSIKITTLTMGIKAEKREKRKKKRRMKKK